MSIFFATVISKQTSIRAPDATTLVLQHYSGTATLSFTDAKHMGRVADAILEATAPPAALDNAVDALRIADLDTDTSTLGGESSKNGASDASNCSASSSEAAPCNQEDNESSFESYDGYGLTQELDF